MSRRRRPELDAAVGQGEGGVVGEGRAEQVTRTSMSWADEHRSYASDRAPLSRWRRPPIAFALACQLS